MQLLGGIMVHWLTAIGAINCGSMPTRVARLHVCLALSPFHSLPVARLLDGTRTATFAYISIHTFTFEIIARALICHLIVC